MNNLDIRKYKREDFKNIQELYKEEGWMTFVNREEDAIRAWENSNITLVMERNGEIIGFLRGISDGYISTYIAEVMIKKELRGRGIGGMLIEACHKEFPCARIDLISSEEAHAFYRRNEFREMVGFRKSFM